MSVTVAAGSDLPAAHIPPLETANDPRILAATQANHYGYFAYIGQLPQIDFHADADAIWHATDIPHGTQNRVVQARFATEAADARIEQILAPYRARRVQMFWWLWEDSTPADLGQRLLSHGLQHTRTSQGMAADLAALQEDFTCAPTLRVEPVRTPAQLRQYVEVASVGFDLPPIVADALYAEFLALGLDGARPLRHYIGLLGDEAVGTSTMFLGGGVAGLYTVATLPAARRQGVATALTLAPFREARAEGYRVGVMLPSPTGFQVYLRLGFAACCRLEVYAFDARER